jgi:hypothetical protein
VSTATLAGFAVTTCRVQIPAFGLPFADVEIVSPETLTGSVTLVLADLTLVGTVLSGGAFQGRARYRIVGGAGGWGATVAAKSYANDLGVKHSTVLTDVANACGESLGTIPAATAGPAYVRANAPAVTVLDGLFPGAWYVDEAGVTQIGARAVTTYKGGAPRTAVDLGDGRIELAADAIATLLPGVTVDGVEAVDVEHVLEGGKLRTTLWGRRAQRTGDPAASALRCAVDLLTARHRYFAPWEYRVVSRSGERLNLQIVRTSSGMPNLSSVRIRPGVAGVRMRPKLGSLVVVAFVNGDAARPMVVAFDDYDGASASPGFIPDETAVVATSVLLGTVSASDPVVRVSDLQAAIDSIRTWVNAHIHVAPGGNTAIPTTPLAGPTATGSAVVKAA